ncbi:MAG: NifB/NifX family molybdenum-iron cluster-binding protein [Anaerolineae bacterium]|nr:NifB/NifX family molybdenum-iron cluster-binding protein [Anaerolineae bacterium]
MKIVVTSSGTTLEAQAHPAFGRCPIYLFINTETMQFEAVENPAENAAGGAGIQAAQFVVERGAQAVVTGNVGPNAFQVLQPAGVPVYLFGGGTVRQAVEAYKAGKLSTTGGASQPAHAGMGSERGAPSREEEIAALRETARELRKQAAEVMERLDRLGAGTSTEGE